LKRVVEVSATLAPQSPTTVIAPASLRGAVAARGEGHSQKGKEA